MRKPSKKAKTPSVSGNQSIFTSPAFKRLKKKHEQRNMGVGALLGPDTVLARKFRWTLEGDGLPESFVQKVSIDYIAQTITFEYIDAVTKSGSFHIIKWCKHLSPLSILTFRQYDGCGVTILRALFDNLKLLSHTSDFDYSSSELSMRRVTVSYGRLTTTVYPQT